MNEAIPDDMWTPYKQLNTIVEHYLSDHTATEKSITNLELILRKHKQNFLNLLKNPPKNAQSREEIRKGITDGVTLPGIGHTVLSKDLVDESIIISDMYNLNEFIALELLCTAQQQMPQHPGLPRGLVAILLYYDGRKTLVTTLKELMQARDGVSWCIETSPDISQLITLYTDNLVLDGLLIKIIELLNELEITKEIEILSENRALGPPKHHRQVVDYFEDIRIELATILFCYSAQCGLSKAVTCNLINYLSKYKSISPSGGIDNVTLAILMALLYGLDVSVIQKREDGEEIVERLPIINEKDFMQNVYDALCQPWETEELRSIVLFAYGLALAGLRQAPQIIQRHSTKLIDQDEGLIEAALDRKLFDFIYHILLENEKLFQSEFYFRRIHILLTDFIELMPSKITELRARADETARTVQLHAQQGLDPPSVLCRNFETLLLVIGKFYSNEIRIGLHLDLEYWGPMDIAGNYQRSSVRSVALFKFVRLAGELLPPTLFIPYLKMLAGLSNCQQSARNAFNLLKQGSGISSLSWDHFFNSLSRYYTNLRMEQHPLSDTVYRNRSINRNMIPQEIAGLQAVLQVIRAVATHDSVARIALCEHPSWAPLHVLLGLVSCSIVIPLKTDLLLTLAALGKSRETAIQLWINLEASQIITTVPSTNSFNNPGVESELEQVESRNETYPLTQAILDFLYVLVTTAIPKNLGIGPRQPGLDPYLLFVVDTIFLRFYNRIYKNPMEKWDIAEKCLKLLNYFIRTYEVNPVDFPSNTMIKNENPPPGFHVMLQMNTNEKSDLLKLILLIIDETCTIIDSYAQYPGKIQLEKCALYSLQIIEKSLTDQDLFFDAHYSANCSILLSGINKLLLGVNRRTGNPDHMLNITKFVTYNSWLPMHALTAVKILSYVSSKPNVNALLLSEFTSTLKLTNEIRHGFVECLESEVNTGNNNGPPMDDLKSMPMVDDWMTNNDQTVELNLKETIIKLIEDCLPQSAPNLAHYLLGFDITKDIRATRLQQPGVMDFPSTCIRSLVTILDNGLEQSNFGKRTTIEQERLIQSAYRLLYSLCLNTKTSEVVLRFLRSCNDFLCRHVMALPFGNITSPYVLNQMSGLLKCIAIELKITAANNHLTQFGNLCKILLNIAKNSTTLLENGQNVASSQMEYTGGDNLNNHQNTTNFYSTMLMDSVNIFKNHGDGGRGISASDSHASKLLICKLLECLDFDVKTVDVPNWDFFDNSLMQQLLQSCEISSNSATMSSSIMSMGIGGSGPSSKLINIKKLHEVLKDEVNIVQNTIAAGQRQLILKETESVLQYAVKINLQKNICTANIQFLEAWGQLTEILFCVAPASVLSHDIKQALILEILQVLLIKVVPADLLPELENIASSTVLQLLVNLRLCYKQRPFGNSATSSNSIYLLETSNLINPTAQQLSPKGNTLSLKNILKKIVEWIIISGVASQKLRINLYSSLLNFMHIIKGDENKHHQQRSDFDNKDEYYISRLDRSMGQRSSTTTMTMTTTNTMGQSSDDNIDRNQVQMVIEVFNEFGDKITDMLCHDCINGHDVCKMLSLSCIDVLLELDSMVGFTQFISKRGYLAHLVDSLMKTDKQLCRILEATPDNLKALYVYESKMAMLSRIACSHIGAELLLEQRTLTILSSMKVYDMHPEIQFYNYSASEQFNSQQQQQHQQYNQYLQQQQHQQQQQQTSFIPSIELRYQQILFPAINLCDVILSTLGSENQSAITQILHFLLSHGDLIEIVLRAGAPTINYGLLQELSAITGLIARTANQELSSMSDNTISNQDLGAHLYRLQKLMLALIPRFILSETMIKGVHQQIQQQQNHNHHQQHQQQNQQSQPPAQIYDKNKSRQMKLILQIASNLALYARNAIANHSVDHRTTGVLFSPNINDVQRNDFKISGSGLLEKSQSLGVIVSQLKNTVQYFNREKNAFDNLLRQRNALPNLSLDVTDQIQYANLTECLNDKQEELKLCIFLTEHCLYLLWAHLDFYMLRAISVNSLHFNNSNNNNNSSNNNNNNIADVNDAFVTSPIDATWKVTAADISNLKKTLVQVFNETFCNQLNATTQDLSEYDKRFIGALLRRIQRLIQFVPVK